MLCQTLFIDGEMRLFKRSPRESYYFPPVKKQKKKENKNTDVVFSWLLRYNFDPNFYIIISL